MNELVNDDVLYEFYPPRTSSSLERNRGRIADRARVDAIVVTASDGVGGAKAFDVVATKATVATKREQVETQVGDFILLEWNTFCVVLISFVDALSDKLNHLVAGIHK